MFVIVSIMPMKQMNYQLSNNKKRNMTYLNKIAMVNNIIKIFKKNLINQNQKIFLYY